MANATQRKANLAKKGAPRDVPRSPAPEPAWQGGFALARVEMRSDEEYRVRTTTGARLTARLSPEVEPSLVDECLRHGRLVVVVPGEEGPLIAGAIQTTRGIALDQDGNLAVSAQDIRLKAEKGLRIEADGVTLAVDRTGILRVEGDKMTIDMGMLVRFLSARVELP